MTEPKRDDLDQRLDDWLAEGPERAPERIAATAATRSRGIGQSPGWIARLRSRPPQPWRAGLGVVAVAAVAVAAVAVGLQAGFLQPAPGPGTTPSISATSPPNSLRARVEITHQTGLSNAGAVASGFGSIWVGGRDRFVVRLDPATGEIVARIAIPGEGCGPIQVTGRSVWYASCGTGPLAGPETAATLRIDPTTNVLVNTYADATTDGVGVGSLGGGVWFISDVYGGGLTLVDDGTGAERAHLDLGLPIRHLTAGFGSLWVVPMGEGQARVLRIDPASGAEQASIALSGDGAYLLLSADAIWVAEPFQWLVARVDPTTNKTSAELGAAPGADELVLDESGHIWVMTEAEAIGFEIAGIREVDRFSVPGHTAFAGVATHPLGSGFGSLWYAFGGDLYRLAPTPASS